MTWVNQWPSSQGCCEDKKRGSYYSLKCHDNKRVVKYRITIAIVQIRALLLGQPIKGIGMVFTVFRAKPTIHTRDFVRCTVPGLSQKQRFQSRNASATWCFTTELLLTCLPSKEQRMHLLQERFQSGLQTSIKRVCTEPHTFSFLNLLKNKFSLSNWKEDLNNLHYAPRQQK